jgi:T5orf172 domain-containing protein
MSVPATWVYLATGKLTGAHKLGSTVNVKRRVQQIHADFGDRFALTRVWERPKGDDRAVEYLAHQMLRSFRVQCRHNELYCASAERISQTVEECGCKEKWGMFHD